jgi:hypothetical protein
MIIMPRVRSRIPRVFVTRPLLAMCLVLIIGISACASLPPAKSVGDVREIAGKWEGTGTGPGGAVGVRSTINPDGSFTSVIGERTFTGKIQVVDGKLRGRGDQTGNTGTWTLHEGDGKRTLVYRSDDGRVGAELTPAK